MNYLLHYYLDAHHATAAYSVGGALPDLSRLRGQGFRLRVGHWGGHLAGPVPELTPTQTMCEAGLARHYAVDAQWHNSALFTELQQKAKEVVAAQGLQVKRTSFLVHIGTEMLLDRALLHAQPDIATQFYACFTPAALEAVYSLVALKGHGAWLPKLQTGIEAFVRRAYLQDYAGTYLARTWPEIYQHVTGDATACTYPEAQWLAAVKALTEAFRQQVIFKDLRQAYSQSTRTA